MKNKPAKKQPKKFVRPEPPAPKQVIARPEVVQVDMPPPVKEAVNHFPTEKHAI